MKKLASVFVILIFNGAGLEKVQAQVSAMKCTRVVAMPINPFRVETRLRPIIVTAPGVLRRKSGFVDIELNYSSALKNEIILLKGSLIRSGVLQVSPGAPTSETLALPTLAYADHALEIKRAVLRIYNLEQWNVVFGGASWSDDSLATKMNMSLRIKTVAENSVPYNARWARSMELRLTQRQQLTPEAKAWLRAVADGSVAGKTIRVAVSPHMRDENADGETRGRLYRDFWSFKLYLSDAKSNNDMTLQFGKGEKMEQQIRSIFQMLYNGEGQILFFPEEV